MNIGVPSPSPSSSSSFNDSSYYSNDQQSGGGFMYGLGFSIGILLLVIILTLASYLCTRMRLIPHDAPIAPIHRYSFTSSASLRRRDRSSSLEEGLDDDALGSFPKFPYSQAKDHIVRGGGDGAGGESCSICLADYKGSDLLRLLPDCGHVFHVKCVDPWLRSHPTCPVCRSSPVPSPLAEVTPFATRLS